MAFGNQRARPCSVPFLVSLLRGVSGIAASSREVRGFLCRNQPELSQLARGIRVHDIDHIVFAEARTTRRSISDRAIAPEAWANTLDIVSKDLATLTHVEENYFLVHDTQAFHCPQGHTIIASTSPRTVLGLRYRENPTRQERST
jgi:hypothetical protein